MPQSISSKKSDKKKVKVYTAEQLASHARAKRQRFEAAKAKAQLKKRIEETIPKPTNQQPEGVEGGENNIDSTKIDGEDDNDQEKLSGGEGE